MDEYNSPFSLITRLVLVSEPMSPILLPHINFPEVPLNFKMKISDDPIKRDTIKKTKEKQTNEIPIKIASVEVTTSYKQVTIRVQSHPSITKVIYICTYQKF